MVTDGFYGYHGYQWFSMVTRGYVWSPEAVYMVTI